MRRALRVPDEGGFDYWPGPPEPGALIADFGVAGDPRWAGLLSSVDVRRISVDGWVPGQSSPGFLLWQGGCDVSALDDRIERGESVEDDLVLSVRCVPSALSCRGCGWDGVGLIIPVDGLYAYRVDLHRDKIEMVELLSCPVCAQSLRRMVVARA